MEIVAKEIISSYIPMRYRKLRITWTAICLIACVLLIALWVRSYWWLDKVSFPTSTTIATSYRGTLDATSDAKKMHTAWSGSVSISAKDIPACVAPGPSWHFSSTLGNTSVGFPYWFAVVVFASLATAPWLRRFSLRTLLIATALVAVVLGLIVWLQAT